MTTTVSISDPSFINKAISSLEEGGVIVFPTDTVYGLAAPIKNEKSIERLFSIKGRNFNKAIAVLIGSLDQLSQLTDDFSPVAQQLAASFWPGALTLIVKIKPGLPRNLSPYPTIGIRMPDHPSILKMLKQSGPLATTSANISGFPDTLTAREALDQLGNQMDLLIDGGHTKGAVPSTVVDCTLSDIKILRVGSIDEEAIRKVLD